MSDEQARDEESEGDVNEHPETWGELESEKIDDGEDDEPEQRDATSAPRDSVIERNESTEGLLDEAKLREDADQVSHAIEDAKNRNP